jgi:hypothetical protein
MKRKRFSVEQIVTVLKPVELGMPVADVIRRIRLYKTSGTQLQPWRVQSHPAYNEEFITRALSGWIPDN